MLRRPKLKKQALRPTQPNATQPKPNPTQPQPTQANERPKTVISAGPSTNYERTERSKVLVHNDSQFPVSPRFPVVLTTTRTFVSFPLYKMADQNLEPGPGHRGQACGRLVIFLSFSRATEFIQQKHEPTAHEAALFVPREWARRQHNDGVTVDEGLGRGLLYNCL